VLMKVRKLECLEPYNPPQRLTANNSGAAASAPRDATAKAAGAPSAVGAAQTAPGPTSMNAPTAAPIRYAKPVCMGTATLAPSATGSSAERAELAAPRGPGWKAGFENC
jgi:hypothetical protein